MLRIIDKKEEQLRKKIRLGHNKIGWPLKNVAKIEIKSNSWFDIKKTKFQKVDLKPIKKINVTSKVIKCKKVPIYFNEEQRDIILLWMDAAVDMYNLVISEFRTRYYNKMPIITDHIAIRDVILKTEREELMQECKVPYNIMTNAITRACAAFKAALTNLKNGNINHFRLRNIKYSNSNKVISIDSKDFSRIHNTFFIRLLGNSVDSGNFELKTITSMSTLCYNSKTDKFALMVPEKVDSYIPRDNRKIISFDAGTRTYLTGISDNHIIEICNGADKKIMPMLKSVDKVQAAAIPEWKKAKKRDRINYKIKNVIKDMHWKVIKFLTENYETIIIGEWSTKSCCQGKVHASVKRMMNQLSFYSFLQKLKYKCELTQTNLFITPEHFTSKLCSRCGTYNDKLGSSKVFNCGSCGITIDRDVNGCRNIYLQNQY